MMLCHSYYLLTMFWGRTTLCLFLINCLPIVKETKLLYFLSRLFNVVVKNCHKLFIKLFLYLSAYHLLKLTLSGGEGERRSEKSEVRREGRVSDGVSFNNNDLTSKLGFKLLIYGVICLKNLELYFKFYF